MNGYLHKDKTFCMGTYSITSLGIALSQNLVVGAANVANPSSKQMAVIFAFVTITNIGCLICLAY